MTSITSSAAVSTPPNSVTFSTEEWDALATPIRNAAITRIQNLFSKGKADYDELLNLGGKSSEWVQKGVVGSIAIIQDQLTRSTSKIAEAKKLIKLNTSADELYKFIQKNT